jgi:hypothetical protein
MKEINSRDLTNDLTQENEVKYNYYDYYPTDGSEPIPL